MKHIGLFFAVIGVFFSMLFMAGPTYGQFPGIDPAMDPMAMVRDIQFGPLTLLSRSEVQKELKLNKSQSEDLRKLQKDQAKLLSDRTKSIKGDDIAQMMESMKQIKAAQAEFNSKAKAVLTDAQRQRFGEIRLQVMGVQALQEPETQMALGLTPQQKTQLSSLNTEYTTAKMNSARNVSSTGSYKRKLEAVEKEYQEKFGAALTPEQNDLLKKMQGEPFKDAKKMMG